MARPPKYRRLPKGLSQERVDKMAEMTGAGLMSLPDELLASLPKVCWQRALKHLRSRYGYSVRAEPLKELRARLKAARAQHGQFYVTKYHFTPPSLEGELNNSIRDALNVTLPV